MIAEFQQFILQDIWLGDCASDYTDEQRQRTFEYLQLAPIQGVPGGMCETSGECSLC
jgi:hypothetical protein